MILSTLKKFPRDITKGMYPEQTFCKNHHKILLLLYGFLENKRIHAENWKQFNIKENIRMNTFFSSDLLVTSRL